MKHLMTIFTLSILFISCSNGFKKQKPVVSFPLVAYHADTLIYKTVATKVIKDTFMVVKTGKDTWQEKWIRDTFYVVEHPDSTGKLVPQFCPKDLILTQTPIGMDSVLRMNKKYRLAEQVITTTGKSDTLNRK